MNTTAETTNIDVVPFLVWCADRVLVTIYAKHRTGLFGEAQVGYWKRDDKKQTLFICIYMDRHTDREQMRSLENNWRRMLR